MNAQKIPVGISACLMGQEVRYNGGHKRSVFCSKDLTPYFEYRTYCPEMAIGMGVPRPTIRLQGDFNNPQVVGTKNADLNVTKPLGAYSQEQARKMSDLSGFIFMKDSPSCGAFTTKVYTDNGVHQKRRGGIFASAVMAENPNLPVEEGGRLNDPVLRESFIARVYIYNTIRLMTEAGVTPRQLVDFHSTLKYFAMSYGQRLYKQLGQIVAAAGVGCFEGVWRHYVSALMSGTRKAPNRKGHTNALYHLLGYLKKDVPGPFRQELAASIDEYRKRIVPLAVPMKLVGHYLEHYASDYIRQQVYLQPYPAELGLRNAL